MKRFNPIKFDHRSIFALVAVFVLSCLYVASPRAHGQTNTNKPTRPNILFVIADDWGTDHAGAYGCKWIRTPAFDRLAKEGLLFHRAYTPNAKCAPCRAIILTGRNSWQLEDACNHVNYFPAKFGSFIEALTADGYFCGSTGKTWGPGAVVSKPGQKRQMTGVGFNSVKRRVPGMNANDYADNFGAFLEKAPKDKPWFFWLGTTEPHRGFLRGNGIKHGKKLSDIDRVPAYWPDNDTVRGDMLDYSIEVEHYDTHLGRALKLLDDKGLAANTLVVATSDHGMPFPRCKGQAYEHSNRLPLAIRWPKGIKGAGRRINDFVSFADFAPTFLDFAGVKSPQGMEPITGNSLRAIFESDKSGQIEAWRDHVVIGKERHDIGRPNDWGYPIRGIVTRDYLYLRNYKPDRWPAGNPETGYLNCDGSPTKTLVLNLRRSGEAPKFWQLCFGKRPAEELYRISDDPDCVKNLAGDPKLAKLKKELETRMVAKLKSEGDPRMFGAGDVLESYPYINKGTRNFHKRYMAGEKVNAGWVNKSDFEKGPLEE